MQNPNDLTGREIEGYKVIKPIGLLNRIRKVLSCLSSLKN